jgi:two-component system OmpR family sensor kinase
MDAKRVVAVGSVALTGVGVLAGAVTSYTDAGTESGVALALSVLGVLLGGGLVAGAGYLQDSAMTTEHTLRLAGWNLLGVVAIGLVLVAATSVTGVTLSGYVLAPVVGVSAIGYVLVGYNDVRRMRARGRDREREQLALLTRLAGHALRAESEDLTDTADRLVEDTEDPALRQVAVTTRNTAEDLAAVPEGLALFREVVESDQPRRTLEVDSVVEDALADLREEYPGATVDTELPDGLTVTADDYMETAVSELVENAIEHGSPVEPWVKITATEKKGAVAVTVLDNGPGIAQERREALTGQRDVDELTDATGFGLWVVKAVVDRYDGRLAFDDREHGSAVTLWLTEA